MKAKPKRHRWDRAFGGMKCRDCGMFKSHDDIFYPRDFARAIDGVSKGTPPCKPVKKA